MDRRLGLDDWWKAVRSGRPEQVQYLLSRRGASVLSEAERPGRFGGLDVGGDRRTAALVRRGPTWLPHQLRGLAWLITDKC